LLPALALVAGAIWLRCSDRVDFGAARRARLATVLEQRDHVQRRWDSVQARVQRIQSEIPQREEEIRRADKVVGELKELRSTWERLVGDREQQIANGEQLARMTKFRAESADRVAALRLESKRTIWERDGLEISRARLDAQLDLLQNDGTVAGHYLRLAWHLMKSGIIWGLAIYGAGCLAFFFGGSVCQR